VEVAQPEWREVTGSHIHVVPLPPFVGPYRYIKEFHLVRQICRDALRMAEAVILRTPGNVALTLWSLLKLEGRPYGVEVTGDPYECFAPGSVDHILRPFFTQIFSAALRKQCRGATAASYVTDHTLQGRYPPSPTAFTTNYSSIDLPDEAFYEAPRIYRSSRESVTVASVGSMEQSHKGFDVLIEAIRLCGTNGLRVRLVLVGGGRFFDSLQREADSSGVDALFIGEVAGPQKAREILSGADLFVLPSKTEGLPRVMIEAMAMGLPCIGTKVGGTPELLAPEDIVAPGDALGLAAKIQQVCADPGRMTAMAQRNLHKAREYHVSALNQKRQQMYLRVRSATEAYFREQGEHC
jgi:glycosyltransferase involved in cell wall biosynthesis